MADKVRWEPGDFISTGALCPPAQIRSALDSVREESAAQLAILVVVALEPARSDESGEALVPVRGRVAKFFQSLLYCSSPNGDTVTRVQADLIRAQPELPCELTLEDTVTRESRPVRSSDVCKLLPDFLFADTYQGHTLNWTYSRNTTGPLIAVGLLRAFEGAAPERRPIALEWLATMVNASAPVHIYRNLGNAHRLDLAIRAWKTLPGAVSPSDEPLQQSEQLRDLYRSVVNTAREITSSDVATLYLSQEDPGILNMVACAGEDVGFRSLDVNSNHSVVTTCFARQRPYFINDVRHFEEMHPRIRYKSIGGKGGVPEGGTIAELSVPVLLPSIAGANSKPLGVLNVEKNNADYTSQDFVALRTLAQALAEHRSHFLTDQAHSSIARLVDPQLASDDERFHRAENLIRGQEAPQAGSAYPVEFSLATEELLLAITAVANVTRCHHITIRFLDGPGNLLTRAVEYPIGRGSADLSCIAVKDRTSVNAWVARYGEECYLPIVRGKTAISKYEGLDAVINPGQLLRSEYCLPIFVQGSLVGTLDLESTFPNAFEADRPLIRAVLQQIRLLLRNTQRLFEEQIVFQYSALNLSLHEIAKCTDDLGRFADGAARLSLEEIGNVRNRLLKLLDNVRQQTTGDVANGASVLEDVIVSAAADRKVQEWLDWNADSPLCKVTLDAGLARCLRLTLGEVFDNGFKALMKIKGGRLLMRIYHRERAGRIYLGIVVSHPGAAGFEMLRPIANSAYRIPLKSEGRQHYGAFLVGTLLRSVGGNIRLSVCERTQRVNTILELPISPSGATLPTEFAAENSRQILSHSRLEKDDL